MDCGTPESRKGRPTRLARSDCYTCLAKRRKCDRIRPHCEKCRQLGQECGGFSIQLSWQPGFSTNKKPLKRSIVRKSRRRTYGDSRDAPQFEFISEYPAHTHTDIPSALDTTSPQTPLEPIRDAEVHLSWKSPTTLQFASPSQPSSPLSLGVKFRIYQRIEANISLDRFGRTGQI